MQSECFAKSGKLWEAVGIAGRDSLTLTLTFTHLVVDLALRLLQVNCLGEDIALLFELNALGPVVKGTGHVDLVGGMLPAEVWVSLKCLRQGRSVAVRNSNI